MKKLFITALLFFCANHYAYAQVNALEVQVGGGESTNPLTETYKGYAEEFKKAQLEEFTENNLNQIFSDYSSLVMTGVDTTQLFNAMKGTETSYFPLKKLRDEPFYLPSINTLLHSTNPYKRVLAYITLASSGDSSFNKELLSAAKTETFKSGKFWAGLALLYLRDSHTSDLFDFLVENEEFGDAHMIPFYLELDKDSIRQTAYEKMSLKDPKAKILAVQSLSVTGLNPKTEQVVKEAVRDWEPSIKGYAIYTVKDLGMGNIKDLLIPCLEIKEARGISLQALANSPTATDQEYLSSLIPTNAKVPDDILNAYLTSKRENSVRKWLRLVRDQKIDPKYYFPVHKQPLLASDIMLDEVRDTIRHTKNHEIVHELSRALAGRNDDESVNLLLQLLSDSNSTVRYWAGSSLDGNSSPQLIRQLPDLIRNPKLRTTALTDLAIQNKISGLHDVYESILQRKPEQDWNRSSLEYLAAFPEPTDRELFRAVLQNDKDVFAKRLAVEGLGELRDKNSTGLIETALKSEPPNDQNAITYLVALGKIKDDRAKQIVESYKNSKNDSVQSLVAKILAQW